MERLAQFTVTPEKKDLLATEIYYSYDPNARTRFWHKATANKSGDSWSVSIKVHKKMPLYVHALCRYELNKKVSLERGETTTFVLNSQEQVYMPDDFDANALKKLRKTAVIEDFSNGLDDWDSRRYGSISTYKFQNPELILDNNKKLKLAVDSKGKTLHLILHTDSKFLSPGRSNGSFRLVRQIQPDTKEIIIKREDFISNEIKTLEWDKIVTFRLTLKDAKSGSIVDLKSKEGLSYLKSITMVD